ncbi:MAG: WG repeat-containing protein [Eubacterium sp.]|nr:WG repeat-containing protein [Eubacterium sp.]
MKKNKLYLCLALICAANIMSSCVTNENSNAELEPSEVVETSQHINTTSLKSETQADLNSIIESVDEEEESIDNEDDEEVVFDPDNDIYLPEETESTFVTTIQQTATKTPVTTTTMQTTAAQKTVEIVECDVKFDKAYFFNEGLCPYQDSRTGLWGYMDSQFNVVISPNYFDAYCFSDGLAAVYDGQKWGFINSKGKTILPFEYDSVVKKYNYYTCFYEDNLVGFLDGYAIVTQTNKYSDDQILIDKKGNVVNTSRKQSDFWAFGSNRFGNVVLGSNGEKYICNEKLEAEYIINVPGTWCQIPYGRRQIDPNSNKVFLSDDLAVVSVNSSALDTEFVIDKKGNQVFNPWEHDTFEKIIFAEDTYVIQMNISGVYRAKVYNLSGKEIIGGNYTMIHPICKNGKAMYYIGRYKNGESELLDANGKILNPSWLDNNEKLTIKYLTTYESQYSDYAVVYNNTGSNPKIVNMSTMKLICELEKNIDMGTVNNEQVYGFYPEQFITAIYNDYIIMPTDYSLDIYDLNGSLLYSVKKAYDASKDVDFQEINIQYGIIKTEYGFLKIK